MTQYVTTSKKKAGTAAHYVDNKLLFERMSAYRQQYLEWKDSGEEGHKPELSDYIGRCILLIATGVSKMPNFSGYSFKDDMIDDAIEACVRYAHNFNPEKTENPFAYFSTISYNAFLARIKKEKKQLALKTALIQNAATAADITTVQGHDTTHYNSELLKYLQDFADEKGYNIDLESNSNKPKKAPNKKNLEVFMEEEDEENIADFDIDEEDLNEDE